MIGYKVVAYMPRARCYTSIVHHSNLALKYRVGSWTKRRKTYGALAVFKRLKDARSFNTNRIEKQIFRCEYKPSKLRYLAYAHQRQKTIQLPYGTCFADKVKLLKRVV